MRLTLDIDTQTEDDLIFIKQLKELLGAKIYKTKKGFHVILFLDDYEKEYFLREIWGDDPMRIKHKHKTLWEHKIIKDSKNKIVYESKEKHI